MGDLEEPGEDREPRELGRPAPGFGELLGANLRVVGVVAALSALAYGIWRGLRALFPDVGWLQ